MNCEKCKNKKATLFFADDGGGRHALCAVCGAGYGRSVNVTGGEHTDPPHTEKKVLPDPTLTALCQLEGETFISSASDGKSKVCRTCGISAEEVKDFGRLGCPECYSTFCDLLLPTPPSSDRPDGTRMPSARRIRLDRERMLIELRAELRRAVESESFELAAKLRDRIRELDKI